MALRRGVAMTEQKDLRAELSEVAWKKKSLGKKGGSDTFGRADTRGGSVNAFSAPERGADVKRED